MILNPFHFIRKLERNRRTPDGTTVSQHRSGDGNVDG